MSWLSIDPLWVTGGLDRMIVKEFHFRPDKVKGQARLFTISMIAHETIIGRAIVSSKGVTLYLYHVVRALIIS
ncbi:MAG: hypothetical protein ACTSW1_17650 [Candidatus Hodarchaeales archaeon]